MTLLLVNNISKTIRKIGVGVGVLLFLSCTGDNNYHKKQKEQLNLENVYGKYVIDNDYGNGYVLLKKDKTYEHSFFNGDSLFLDKDKWSIIYNESGQFYEVLLSNWKAHYPVFPFTEPEKEIGGTLVFFGDYLSAYFESEKSNRKYNYLKEK